MSAIMITFGLALTALTVRIQNDRLRHELEERGKLLGTVVAANATDALAHLEVSELRQLMAEARNQENVIDAVVFDDEGRVLTDGTVENPQPPHLCRRGHPPPSGFLRGASGGFFGRRHDRHQTGGARRQEVGGVSLQYSLTALAEDQAALRAKNDRGRDGLCSGGCAVCHPACRGGDPAAEGGHRGHPGAVGGRTRPPPRGANGRRGGRARRGVQHHDATTSRDHGFAGRTGPDPRENG